MSTKIVKTARFVGRQVATAMHWLSLKCSLALGKMSRSWGCFFGKHSWQGVFSTIPGYGLRLQYEICTKCEKIQDA